MFQNPIYRWLLQALLIGTLLRFIAGLPGGIYLVLIMTLVGVAIAATLWILQYQRLIAARACQTPFLAGWIRLVCRLSRQQPPLVRGDGEDPARLPVLRTPLEFEQATLQLRSLVFGHEATIDDLMVQLQKNVLLGERRHGGAPKVPIGRFLFVGPSGVGKRTCAFGVGQLLLSHTSPLWIDLAEYSDPAGGIGALLGGPASEGILTGAIRERPTRTIIFENLQLASPQLVERLGRVLGAGTVADGHTTKSVSLERCLFVFLHHCSAKWLEIASRGASTRSATETRLRESLVADGLASEAFLSQLDGLFRFAPPDQLSKARVSAALLQAECARFHVELTYVAPEILVGLLEHVTPDGGFAALPRHVSQLLKDPLLRAVQNEQPRLQLERRNVTEWSSLERNAVHVF